MCICVFCFEFSVETNFVDFEEFCGFDGFCVELLGDRLTVISSPDVIL